MAAEPWATSAAGRAGLEPPADARPYEDVWRRRAVCAPAGRDVELRVAADDPGRAGVDNQRRRSSLFLGRLNGAVDEDVGVVGDVVLHGQGGQAGGESAVAVVLRGDADVRVQRPLLAEVDVGGQADIAVRGGGALGAGA